MAVILDDAVGPLQVPLVKDYLAVMHQQALIGEDTSINAKLPQPPQETAASDHQYCPGDVLHTADLFNLNITSVDGKVSTPCGLLQSTIISLDLLTQSEIVVMTPAGWCLHLLSVGCLTVMRPRMDVSSVNEDTGAVLGSSNGVQEGLSTQPCGAPVLRLSD